MITPEEEEQLWNSGAMGIFNPKVLLRAVFFCVGKAFCLRGGAQQRSLKPSQFVHGYDPDRYTYTENGSKNHKGGFGTLTPNKWSQCTLLMTIPFEMWFTCLTHTSKSFLFHHHRSIFSTYNHVPLFHLIPRLPGII